MSGWTMPEHGGTCDGTLCGFCGCCCHTKIGHKCKVALAPTGMRCPDRDCGCEGES